MKVTDAFIKERELHVVVDGHRLVAFETKYTILELGYDHVDEDWLLSNGDTIPADPESGRSGLRSGGGTLFTCDPVLFAVCYRHWWTMNGEESLPRFAPIPIPTGDEGQEVLRNRKILNEWNQKWSGFVPVSRH